MAPFEYIIIHKKVILPCAKNELFFKKAFEQDKMPNTPVRQQLLGSGVAGPIPRL